VVEAAKRRGCRTVVEVGSIRADDPNHRLGDGHATLHWVAHFGQVYSYDVDPCATRLTQELAGTRGNLVAQTRDGIDALQGETFAIDLLYLDGWDVGTDGYQEQHLAAFQAACPRLGERSLVLIDDTEFAGHGKAGLVIPYAESVGWRWREVGKQILLWHGVTPL